MSKHEIDDAAYEALKAHPVMVEEAMTNQDSLFWVRISGYRNRGLHAAIGFEIDNAVDSYVLTQVGEFASDEEISVNEAINKLLNRCNGGK